MAEATTKILKEQPEGMIFALDIGTRSIIGIVGEVEDGRLRVVALEKENQLQRSMIDGQIENIELVAKVAGIVKQRLEERLGCRLKRVCVAAAGRALKTQRASFEMSFPQAQRLDEELISRLDAGAIAEAETAFTSDSEDTRQFYLVGHTVVQYYMDSYPTSSLLDHQARQIKAEVIATFLPSEVVDSLYLAMNRIGLEVASLTLEPIAAINAAIPQNLRLLNLALVDIGAGTSDIAVCKDGCIVGYTMATVAGDEITEALMKQYLLDFDTAESAKKQLSTQSVVSITDILGIELSITREDIMNCIGGAAENLCREIAEHICEVNDGPPSAVFLAGGGSKLESLRANLSEIMNMDSNRVAIAGNYFQTHAFSDVYDLKDPEYATPLGIAISSGLNLIADRFHVTLNGSRAKLFRNSSMTVLDILMMNGYSYHDFLPRTGGKLMLEVNGKQAVYYGSPGEAAVLRLNGKDAKISDVVSSGDSIEFTPAVHGMPAVRCVADLLANSLEQSAMVNGMPASPDTLLQTGDIVVITVVPKEAAKDVIDKPSTPAKAKAKTEVPAMPEAPKAETTVPAMPETPKSETKEPAMPETPKAETTVPAVPETPKAETKVPAVPKTPKPSVETVVTAPAETPAAPKPAAPPDEPVKKSPDEKVAFVLNGKTLTLPAKPEGLPYYLMDLLEHAGLDLENPTGNVVLRVNGVDGGFLTDLKPGDQLEIFYASEQVK